VVGEVEAELGEYEWGYETYFGYFAQDHKAQLGSPRQNLLSSLWDDCPLMPMGYCYGKLAQVLFSREETEKRVENLSGGEGARLLMVKIAVKKPNVLVLDEPNNHLDLEGIAALSRDLKAYEGTIIFVSHDRWFVDKLATRIIEITSTGVEDYRGSYTEFMARRNVDHLDKEQTVANERAKKRAKKSKKGAHQSKEPVAKEGAKKRKKKSRKGRN